MTWFITPECTHSGLGSSTLPAATFGIDVFLFLRLLRCFQFTGPGVWAMYSLHTSLEVYSGRFPHSEISGSKDICSSPKLFAAYHVFHRLLVPRHPPCALSSLTSSISTAGTVFIRRCIALHPWSLCLLDSFGYVSFDTPRMSCILNI